MKPFSNYKNPVLAVDLVVFGYNEGELSVLLLNRKEAPFKDFWTLPGAFLQMEETLLQASSRVLAAKIGMDKIYLEQLYTFDDPDRDPRGRVISIAHYALINPKAFTISAAKIANDVAWHLFKELPDLGFDHQQIFELALLRLQSKIMYYPVGFQLLDDLFTMPELHGLYECILDQPIDRRNFTKKIVDSGFVINTGKKRTGSKNRHPDLYQFNKKLKQNSFQIKIQ